MSTSHSRIWRRVFEVSVVVMILELGSVSYARLYLNEIPINDLASERTNGQDIIIAKCGEATFSEKSVVTAGSASYHGVSFGKVSHVALSDEFQDVTTSARESWGNTLHNEVPLTCTWYSPCYDRKFGGTAYFLETSNEDYYLVLSLTAGASQDQALWNFRTPFTKFDFKLYQKKRWLLTAKTKDGSDVDGRILNTGGLIFQVSRSMGTWNEYLVCNKAITK